jgi:poly[(R)-3-hydroxyalkanoate] polymerase subunit PhaE
MATSWTEQTSQMFKLWSEGQKAWLDSLGRLPAGATLPMPPEAAWSALVGTDAAKQTADAWKASIGQWTALLQQGTKLALSQDNLRKIVDPAEWAKPVPGSFDFGIERVIEGPTFATLWDLDRKILRLQQLAQKRAEDSAAYHAIVMAAWTRAAERFTKQIGSGEGGAPATFRELTDRWIKTANDTLLEVHRSAEFLEAQRRVTRSATDYRLAEREIAEAYCDVHHIPTRTEMDEVQRTLYQLRRDLRALQRKLDDAGAAAPAKPSAVRRRSTPRKPKTKKSTKT